MNHIDLIVDWSYANDFMTIYKLTVTFKLSYVPDGVTPRSYTHILSPMDWLMDCSGDQERNVSYTYKFDYQGIRYLSSISARVVGWRPNHTSQIESMYSKARSLTTSDYSDVESCMMEYINDEFTKPLNKLILSNSRAVLSGSRVMSAINHSIMSGVNMPDDYSMGAALDTSSYELPDEYTSDNRYTLINHYADMGITIRSVPSNDIRDVMVRYNFGAQQILVHQWKVYRTPQWYLSRVSHCIANVAITASLMRDMCSLHPYNQRHITRKDYNVIYEICYI